MNIKSTLKSLIKSLAYWTVPEGVKKIFASIYQNQRSIDKYKQEKILVKHLTQKNINFKNVHQGRRCFILATGPSVKTQNLSLLEHELCIGVSQFYLHKDIELISPEYHVLAPSHPPFNFNDLNKVFEGLKNIYGDRVTCFLGYAPYAFSNYRFLQEHPEFKHDNQYFLNYSGSSAIDESNYSDDDIWAIEKNPFSIRTVVYSALQIAIYMGCKEVYLIGCDHDYLNDTNRVTNHHFYKEEAGISDAEHLSEFTTERWFEEYYFRWKQYRLIRNYAQSVGCQIFNATAGGMLDIFPRVKLEDVTGLSVK